MFPFKLTKIKMHAGVWHGVVTGREGVKPQIEARHENTVLPDVTLTRDMDAGHWTIAVPIPATAISDGVQTLTLRDVAADQVIGHITLMTGDAASEDIRAEVDLLRAELDLLKRAFRRHSIESKMG